MLVNYFKQSVTTFAATAISLAIEAVPVSLKNNDRSICRRCHSI
ncbi:hypothetical protein APHACPA_0058 [Rickettsia amblyommatis str. Ac/Pa]|uniref:Uncharacterized protein n=1 Tax=Rickettsia amblyommatis str. Ac/Pa TaxID=1359164 RepID=A0A0F3MZ84_RICAM|nr:hypothetical protein APHACPA_0058 [Rickettsia amblyommatis str. Ac/Pa]